MGQSCKVLSYLHNRVECYPIQSKRANKHSKEEASIHWKKFKSHYLVI
jgi:hypothetical protein